MRVTLKKEIKTDGEVLLKNTEGYLKAAKWGPLFNNEDIYLVQIKNKLYSIPAKMIDFDCRDTKVKE